MRSVANTQNTLATPQETKNKNDTEKKPKQPKSTKRTMDQTQAFLYNSNLPPHETRCDATLNPNAYLTLN